jgi:ribulose-phosphate 3-epimerase
MNRAMLSPSAMCMFGWGDMEITIEKLQQGGADLLHIDVMDGVFVPNLMLGTENIKYLRKISPLPLDIHLMIEHPEEKLDWFDIQPCEYVSVHVESTNHLQRALTRIRRYGAHPIAALNPATPLCMIEEVTDDIDAVLLMTVNPGFAGQELVPQTLHKMNRLRRMLDEIGRPDIRIEVDGNVSFEHGSKMRDAGADLFVCGTSSIFDKSGTILENIERFRNCIEKKWEGGF